MGKDIAAVWRGLQAWSEAHRPSLLENLGGPAAAADLEALAACGLPVPATLLASLAIHDGESDYEGALFEGGGTLLSAARILETRDMLAETFADEQDDLPPAPTIGPVRPQSFNERWLPIMDMNGDVTWYLDFDPAPGGVAGQVVRVDLESGEWVVCAESYEAFLAAYLDDLEQGRIYDEDGEPRDEQPWPPLHRVPALRSGVADPETLRTLESLGRWDVIEAVASRTPMSPVERLRLEARSARQRGDLDAAIAALDAIDAARATSSEDVMLRVDVLASAGDDAGAVAALGAAIGRAPSPGLLARRAELTLSTALRLPPNGGQKELEWIASPAGQQALAVARERALADYDAALAMHDDIEWRLARADLLCDSQRWDEAEQACEAISAALQGDRGPMAAAHRSKAEYLLERAQQRGEDEPDAAEMKAEFDAMLAEMERQFGGAAASALEGLKEISETLGGLQQQEAEERARLDAEPDSTRRRAREVAAQLARRHADTPERFAPFDPAELEPKARQWYDSARDALVAAGYEHVADVEPVRNTEVNGQRALVRVLLSADRGTVAVLWRLAAGRVVHEVLELESELADGRTLLTNNTGNANPFMQPASIEVLALPSGAPIHKVLGAHGIRLGTAGPTRTIPDIDAVLAMQERQRIAKREQARRDGWVHDAELRGLLGGSYGELAPLVREELALLL